MNYHLANVQGGTYTTAYIGGYFEWQNSTGKSYYFAGGQRIAMRTSTGVKFLLGDHLGSTAVTALASGAFDTETRYYPWGGVRWSSGVSPTDYQFTGQQNVASIGLYFYNARFYDAALGRFVQADTIIPNPGDSVSYDRFSYTRDNPVKYVDPSGHMLCEEMPWEENCVNTIEQLYHGYITRGVSLRFYSLPVDTDKLSSLQWFGATDFAYQDHQNFINGTDNYNYDGYCQGMHCGVDFGADWGEPVYAGIYGEVISTSSPSVGGNFSVTVQYGDYQILYQHLSNMAVEIGDIVGPDTMIGSIGNPAGNESLGNNHLHMEVRHDADGSGWAELIENPLGFMSVRQVQSLQISATEFLRTNPSNPGLLFSHWDTSDLFLQPNPIHRGGVVLWP